RRELLEALVAVEDPHRLEEQAAERYHRLDVVVLVIADGLARAALDEGEVDALLAVAQQHQVLARAYGRAQLDLDAEARELRHVALAELGIGAVVGSGDRKSTRLNSSHSQISYAVFCLKKKN